MVAPLDDSDVISRHDVWHLFAHAQDVLDINQFHALSHLDLLCLLVSGSVVVSCFLE